MPDAGDGYERRSARCVDGLHGEPEVMSTDSVAWGSTAAERRPIAEILHEWITTVDHKRLGILYVVYALVFLLFGGVEAIIMRIQLIHSQNNFVSPQVF